MVSAATKHRVVLANQSTAVCSLVSALWPAADLSKTLPNMGTSVMLAKLPGVGQGGEEQGGGEGVDAVENIKLADDLGKPICVEPAWEGGTLVLTATGTTVYISSDGQERTVTQRSCPTLEGAVALRCSRRAKACFAITAEGNLVSWGDAPKLLGRWALTDQPAGKPHPVEVPGEIVDVRVGGEHVVALSRDGRVWSWGSHKLGRLGFTIDLDQYLPSLVSSLSTHPIGLVSVGEAHSAALAKDGRVFMWGDNAHGQLGVANVKWADQPISIKRMAWVRLVSVACADKFTAFLSELGQVFVTTGRSAVQLVPHPHWCVSIAAGPSQVLAVCRRVNSITCRNPEDQNRDTAQGPRLFVTRVGGVPEGSDTAARTDVLADGLGFETAEITALHPSLVLDVGVVDGADGDGGYDRIVALVSEVSHEDVASRARQKMQQSQPRRPDLSLWTPVHLRKKKRNTRVASKGSRVWLWGHCEGDLFEDGAILEKVTDLPTTAITGQPDDLTCYRFKEMDSLGIVQVVACERGLICLSSDGFARTLMFREGAAERALARKNKSSRGEKKKADDGDGVVDDKKDENVDKINEDDEDDEWDLDDWCHVNPKPIFVPGTLERVRIIAVSCTSDMGAAVTESGDVLTWMWQPSEEQLDSARAKKGSQDDEAGDGGRRGSTGSVGTLSPGQQDNPPMLGRSGNPGRPERIPSRRGEVFVDVCCGAGGSVFAITEDLMVVSWGEGSSGQLGHGDRKSRRRIATIAALSPHRVLQVAAGDNHTAAVTCDGACMTWGSNMDGQLGHDDDATEPTRVRLPSKAVQVACGATFTVFTTDEGDVYLSGKIGRHDGDVAAAAASAANTYIRKLSLPFWCSQIACGPGHVMALCENPDGHGREHAVYLKGHADNDDSTINFRSFENVRVFEGREVVDADFGALGLGVVCAVVLSDA